MCIAQMPAREATASESMAGSPSSPVTSLMISAPHSRARSATAAFEVSIDTGTPDSRTSRRTTSAVRRISSSASTGVEKGRVLSPPTSRRSAPSATRRKPCATAASTAAWRPPSEKLSGVTLTIPITSGRRSGPVGCGSTRRVERSCQSVGSGAVAIWLTLPAGWLPWGNRRRSCPAGHDRFVGESAREGGRMSKS